MTAATPEDVGRKALVLPDWDEAYYDIQKITRIMRRLAEGLIQGSAGEDENADLFAWLAERLEGRLERLDQAVRLVPQPRPAERLPSEALREA